MSNVSELMQILKISEKEVRQMLEDDKAIDKGEKLFELSEEQKKNAKQARQADRSPTVYTFSKRERKADEDKRFLIKELTKAVSTWKPEVTNQEREIEFVFNNRKFKITLSAPRK